MSNIVYHDVLLSYTTADEVLHANPGVMAVNMWVKFIPAEDEFEAIRKALDQALREKKDGVKVLKWRYSKQPKGMDRDGNILS